MFLILYVQMLFLALLCFSQNTIIKLRIKKFGTNFENVKYYSYTDQTKQIKIYYFPKNIHSKYLKAQKQNLLNLLNEPVTPYPGAISNKTSCAVKTHFKKFKYKGIVVYRFAVNIRNTIINCNGNIEKYVYIFLYSNGVNIFDIRFFSKSPNHLKAILKEYFYD